MLFAFRLDELLFSQFWGDRSIRQVNISRTDEVGSVRGLHLQSSPYVEMKIVRRLRGRVWDVAVDLRPDSATFGEWHAVELVKFEILDDKTVEELTRCSVQLL